MNTRPAGANHYSPVFSTRPPISSYQSSPHRNQPIYSRSHSQPSTFRHDCTPYDNIIAPPVPSLPVAPPNNFHNGINNNNTTRSCVNKPNRLPFQKLATTHSKKPYGNVVIKQNVNEDANNQNEAIPASLMQPLYCKICSIGLNAPAQAKQHYDGKNHAKKLKQFMDNAKTVLQGDQNQNQNGECSKQIPLQEDNMPLQKPLSPVVGQSSDINPEVYCKICEASFNSPKQAEQHYQGKNHAKRLRASQSVSTPVTMETTPTTVASPTPTNTSPATSNNNIKQPSKFMCFICGINVTSQDQLDSHLQGVKHMTKVKMQERSLSFLKGRWGNDTGALCGIQNALGRGIRPMNDTGSSQFSLSPPMNKKRRRDFSNYRTPSGKYYCSCCNVTLQTEGQFAQHIDSKKHKSSNSSRRFMESFDT